MPLTLIAVISGAGGGLSVAQPRPNDRTAEWFAAPAHGFVSRKPARDWEHSLLTGNGTMGAMVLGNPCLETIYLSHAALYFPRPDNDNPITMTSHLAHIRELCLDGKFQEASMVAKDIRKENDYHFGRDPFIGAFSLQIEHPETDVSRYQRSVDFMTGEAHVTFTGESATIRRSTFVSRADDVIVVRIAGTNKQNVSFGFKLLPPQSIREIKEIGTSVKNVSQGLTKDGKYLHFNTLFEPNCANPIKGYEGLGKVITQGGWRAPTFIGKCWTGMGLKITDANEVLLLITIRPLLKSSRAVSEVPAIAQELETLPTDYATLLTRHAAIHGDLMRRVSFSLNAPESDRTKATEDLIKDSVRMESPLAQIERSFEAGRYNIISSTGYNPPNLQGLWSATWLAPWGGSLTADGNLQSAISFLSIGRTPELTECFIRFNERFLPGFRRNMKELYGMRGFHVPAQITASPRITDFSHLYPLHYWHAGAAWFCQFYYDHWQHTGDRKFLEERAYPLFKEAAAFYEEFLTVTDNSGHVVFVPSYSPENAPDNGQQTHACINATMDVGAAKQLLRHAIAAAKELGRDEELQRKWTDLLAKVPPYEVSSDGFFREWLWPGLKDHNEHRHASHLYPLYDEMPPEIVDDPALLKAVAQTGRARMAFHAKNGQMAYGIVLVGLAAAHSTDGELAQRAINELATRYWSTGMGSFHCPGTLFNMDISGGLPYLCTSTLVYSDPGVIRFFPTRPSQWPVGSIKGVRLRGAITLIELTWSGSRAKAVLVSDKDQTVTITGPGIASQKYTLKARQSTEVNLERK